ncbi:hypothetical protein [Gimesia aquarii]|uniref:hypothetical protein n=1 Tax=Gimesia aquarii TaxID=2527964 RepID=UPI0011A4FC23|nr:hypothetical protein [Gimesia aquarii]
MFRRAMGRQGANPGIIDGIVVWNDRPWVGYASARKRALASTSYASIMPGFDEVRNHNPGDPETAGWECVRTPAGCPAQ